jgi:RNase P/RNase MRP subunit p30
MMRHQQQASVPLLIRRLLPNAREEQLREAAETFQQYMLVVRGIYERINRERPEQDSRESGIRDRFGGTDQNV